MKFDMRFKNINIKEHAIQQLDFSKLTMLIYLMRVVALGYN